MTDSNSSTRLASIDLLRGAAALMVAACHAFDGRLDNPPWLKTYFLLPITYGSSGVYLFFVISGFCIHLRWAREAADGAKPSIDFSVFWQRRVRRLYPAYLATLLICLAIRTRGQPVPDPAPFWWDITSHLLMINNFDARTTASINGVFWTLAVEEQLYLLYFALLHLRIRYGWAFALGTTLVVRFGWAALAFLLQPVIGIDLVVSCSAQATWCIWALGALAVEASVGLVKLPRWTGSLPLAAALFAVGAALTWHPDLLRYPRTALQQLFYGGAAFIVVNSLVGRERSLLLSRSRLLRTGVWLGTISYSVYLTHQVAYAVTTEGLLGMAVAVVFAAVFFQIFERPFLGRPASQTSTKREEARRPVTAVPRI